MLSNFLYIRDNKFTGKIESMAYDFPFETDDFQKHAFNAIENSENILVTAHTGSGKTVPAIYGIAHSIKKNKKIIYTSPIKSLSNQKYEELSSKFPDIGILTGDIKFNPSAQCIIMTTEILRNILYTGSQYDISIDEIDKIIFDEVHYINNLDRGVVWEECLILLPKHITLIMLSATIDKPEEFASWIGNLKEKNINLISNKRRVVPLTHYYYKENRLIEIVSSSGKFMNYDVVKKKYKTERFGILVNPFIEYLTKQNLLPCLFFIFSKDKCEKYCKQIHKSLVTPEESANINNIFDFKLAKYKKLYERTEQFNSIKQLLMKGIAFHHSGVIPILKEIIEILFAKGLIKVLFATETFAVGVNMPTKTVIFTKLTKFCNGSHRHLAADEYLQMAGRAGRRGIDKIGCVIILPVEDLLNKSHIQNIMTGKPASIQSKFTYSYQFILKLINNSEHTLDSIINNSLYNKDIVEEKQKAIKELEVLRCDKLQFIEEYEFMKTDIKLMEEYKDYETLLRNTYIKIKPKKLKTIKSRKEEIEKLKDFENKYRLYNVYLYSYIYKIKSLENTVDYLESTNKNDINKIIDLLLSEYYINFKSNIEICSKDEYFDNIDKLTLTIRGTIGKNISECNEILFSELIVRKILLELTEEELVCMLCIFVEERGDNIYLKDLDIPENCKLKIKELEDFKNSFEKKEESININSNWNLYYGFVMPGYRWACGDSMEIITVKYGIYEGNFIKNMIKIDNICENIRIICDIIKDYELMSKIVNVHSLIIREQVNTDSLYINE